ncbi:MAG: SpoIIE family protein phosphatase, partial [Syntrophales bacterium]|nr:SpoIIE family protein phosphatase [Syntrophales bacterium]
LGHSAASDSAVALENLGAELIRQKALDVALQCRIFILSHRGLTVKDLQRHPEFKKIAVQSVGRTGYTIIYEQRTGIMRFHPNPELVNYDMHLWKDMLPEFWELFEKTLDGSAGGGYYNWRDSDGEIRRKYMYMTPIEGTPFMVAATTYIDEFSRPAEETRLRIAGATKKMNEEVDRTINGIHASFSAILLVIALLVIYLSFVISRTITQPILALIKGAKAIGRVEMEYKVQVTTGDELEELADSFNKMSSDLKWHMEDLKCTTAEKERLQKELEIARSIQQRLLPQNPPEIEGLDIWANNIPAQEVGGDFYDFIPVSLDSWGFVIADVSGKGMAAAIFMGLSRTLIRASTTDNPRAAEAIRQANELICRDSTSGMFVTVFYAVYHPPSRRLRYVNAGHNPPLLIREGNKAPLPLKGRGIALGVIHFIDIEECEITLERGDMV